MKQYLELLNELLQKGVQKSDRTGVGTRSLFGRQLRYDLQKGLPLLTTKKIHLKSIIYELIWFLSGDTNVQFLQNNGVTIWDEWATEQGDLGPVYGAQWRHWRGHDGNTFDQVEALISNIKKNPDSRRHIISGWNVADLPDEGKTPQQNVAAGKMALPPCHLLYQWYVAEGKLSGSLYIRSNDFFLGNPYNTASLAIFTHMLAQQCELNVGEIILSIGDCHLYNNHIKQAYQQIKRSPKPLPILIIKRKPKSIFDYRFEDFIVEGYEPHAPISAPIAV